MGIRVKNLTKKYGEQIAVNDISFEAKKGEILGFLGPNGAGKSTTMKIATCFIPPTSGSIEVCGLDVVKNPIEVRQKIGYLPEHNPLYLDMYVHEYLRYMASMYKVKNRKAKVSEMVSLVGLEREQNKKIGTLSKGYRQRVGLAQTLIHDPEVLILDEPTTGLDPNQLTEVRNIIKEVSQEKTVMLSTHIMQEVQALCQRVIILNKGNMVADQGVDELQYLGKQYTQIHLEFATAPTGEYFHELPSLEEIHKLEDHKYILDFAEQEGEDVRVAIFQKAVEKGIIILEMRKEKISLEEAFHELTK
ncbi:gliding motility-associated ABC transporter ATP-binding subunit GldA [Sediminitomix flava]|uniref:Protein involved in gliding motility GldA n=1 Tax=Sediminitomix flava TaxID=379075 RepID=A0A315ZDZ7_SEDFL|nr:gliding motility-associated ABC transporter ATP-binding subunit GldA [Sediminitomix flava]PWJ43761.1 protein involved in gliding motility GldA [Sediminitomix flava]